MDTHIGIQDKEYLRMRLDPRRGDPEYLHLSDLVTALRSYGTEEALTILDYGSGGAPYQSLFPKANYKKADVGEVSNIDYVIGYDGRIDEEDETFDLILLTQVAEHVHYPREYFDECYRLLRLGGLLLCTTHGNYPEHGCPYDFQRWTAEGLARDLVRSGFEIDQVLKLTTNGRAVMYLIQRFSGWFETPSSIISPFFRIIRSFMHRFPRVWHRLADNAFQSQRIVETSEAGNEFYIGLLVAARKRHAKAN